MAKLMPVVASSETAPPELPEEVRHVEDAPVTVILAEATDELEASKVDLEAAKERRWEADKSELLSLMHNVRESKHKIGNPGTANEAYEPAVTQLKAKVEAVTTAFGTDSEQAEEARRLLNIATR